MNNDQQQQQESANPDENFNLLSGLPQKNEPNNYSKTYNIGRNGEKIQYKGPKNGYVDDLFELLDEKDEESNIKVLRQIKQMKTDIEQWFKQKCVFLGGRLEVTPYFLLLSILYIIIYIIVMAESISLINQSNTELSTVQQQGINQLPYYGLLFTFIPLILIQIKNGYIKALILVVGILAPSCIIVIYYLNIFQWFSSTNENIEQYVLLGTIIVSLLNGGIINGIYDWIMYFLSEIWAMLFAIGWCVLIAYLFGFYLIEYILTNVQIETVKTIQYITGSLTVPVILTLIFSYLLIKARIFDWPNAITATAISRIEDLLQKKYIQPNQYSDNQCFVFLRNYNLKFVSISIGILYLLTEIFLFFQISLSFTEDTIDYVQVAAYSILLIGVLVYLFSGILIVFTNRLHSQTYLVVPLLLGIPLCFISFLVINQIREQSNMETVIRILQYSPICLLILWLTLNLIGIERRRQLLYAFGFQCYFISFPLGILYPLYSLSNNSAYLYIIYVLVVVALILLIYLVIYQFGVLIEELWKVRDISSDDYPDFGEYSYYNLTNPAHWINAILFLITYYWLTDYYFIIQQFQDDQSTPTEQGTLYALMVIHPILFLLINRALSAKSLELKEDFVDSNNLNAIKMEEQENRIKAQTAIQQNKIVAAGILLPLLVCIPIGFITSDERLSVMMLGLGGGIALSFIIFKLLLFIKNKSQDYEHFFQPSASSLMWCCIIFPIGLVTPILAVQYSNRSEEFQVLVQATVAFGLFVCLFGVTTFSLFFSILLNKEEFERKKRAVLKKVIEVLEQNHVYTEMAVATLLFLRFEKLARKQFRDKKGALKSVHKAQVREQIYQELQKQMTEDLINGNPVNVLEYNNAKQLNFDHKLVTISQYQKVISGRLETQATEKERNANPYVKCLLDCLLCRIGLEELNELENQKDSKILELADMLKIYDNHEELLDGLVPGFRNLRTFQQPNQIMTMELDPMGKMLSQQQQYLPLDQIKSSKTDQLREIEKKQQTEKALLKVKTTDFYISLENNDQLVSEFLHEVFMEFANQDLNLPSSVCYNDFLEFLRLSEVKLKQQDFKRFAQMPWLNQSHSMSEQNFASALKSLFKPGSNHFEELKQVVLNTIYPNLLLNMRTLMINVKSLNRKVLQNKLDQSSPFSKEMFNSDQIVALKTAKEQMNKQFNAQKQENQSNSQVSQKDLLVKIPPKSKKQRQLEFQKGQEQIEKEYKDKLPWYKKCCYGCCQCLRTLFCDYPKQCLQRLFAPFKDEKDKDDKEIKIDVFNQRKLMPPWPYVSRLTIQALTESVLEYEKSFKFLQKEGFHFRLSVSNFIVLIFRFQDIYGLTSLALSDQVGWFGTKGEKTKTTIQEYISFDILFWISFGLSIIYGILGFFAAIRVQNNTFGLDERGVVANFTHPQFYFTKAVQTLSGQFILVLSTFIDAFICNFNVEYPYTMYQLSDVVCLSNTHYIYMVFAFLGALIYYPLSTFFQPNFQFSDHSLDLKYKTSFLILYIQVKLLILGVGSLFVNFNNSIVYQLIFSAILLFLLIILYIKMQPCYVKWFNQIEFLCFLIVFALYIGAIIVSISGDNTLGLIFTIGAIAICFLVGVMYVIYNLFNIRSRERVVVESELAKDYEIKLSTKKQQINVHDMMTQEQKENESKKQRDVKQYKIINAFNEDTHTEQQIVIDDNQKVEYKEIKFKQF